MCRCRARTPHGGGHRPQSDGGLRVWFGAFRPCGLRGSRWCRCRVRMHAGARRGHTKGAAEADGSRRRRRAPTRQHVGEGPVRSGNGGAASVKRVSTAGVRHAGRAGDVSDCRFRTVPDGSAGLRSVEDSVIELGSDLGRKAALRATDVGFDQMMLPMPFTHASRVWGRAVIAAGSNKRSHWSQCHMAIYPRGL